MNKKNITLFIAIACAFTCVLPGCSVKKTTVNLVAGSLAKDGGGSVFSGDDDPQLIGEALPFTIKLYESLVATSPNNPQLLLATGVALATYAYAYVQMPAEQLSYSDLETKQEMLERAKRLYLRARDNCLRAIAIRHHRFKWALDSNDIQLALKGIGIKDTTYLYWAGLSWMGAITADKADVELAMSMPKAVAMLQKVLDVKESFGDGAVHEFFISYYGSLPAAMGGSEEKARAHFESAVKFSKGLKLGPYLALATTVCVKKQAKAEFISLLDTALHINVNKNTTNRLSNILSQQKAHWLLEHVDDFFLPAEGDTVQ
jgi:predicted anti-sigma-YlaC factor YlaD